MNAGTSEVHATYWLLDAPDSMLVESHRNPDGTGVGWFGADGVPHLDKQPVSAFADSAFTSEGRDIDACTMITHIRAATAGSESVVNTHPFEIDGLIVAHNGGFSDLDKVDAELGDFAAKVQGQTDSERYAALIAKFTRDNGGHVAAGMAEAANWLSRNVPMYSLNCLVAVGGYLWALRYPDARALHVARRRIDPADGDVWEGASALAGHRLGADQPVDVVLVASERIDGTDDWRMLDPGELLRIGPDLRMSSRIVVDHPPARLLQLSEKDPNVDDV